MNPRDNALLAAMPTQEYAVFLQHLELVSLLEGDVLFETGEIPDHVYFPTGAVISIICELGSEASMETNMIGSNSLVGHSNTGVESFYNAKVRKTGFVYRMNFQIYRRIRHQCPVFMESLGHIQLASFRYISLTAACGRLHPVDQQVMRWMLLYMDRAKEALIHISHAELAALVGCRRVAVTLALGKLQGQGVIKMGRGNIEVLNRCKLEYLACECYWRISSKMRPLFTPLLGQARSHSTFSGSDCMAAVSAPARLGP